MGNNYIYDDGGGKKGWTLPAENVKQVLQNSYFLKRYLADSPAKGP
jgi:hypothetical protein